MNKPVAIQPPHVLEIVAVGDAHGVILPPEVLARLGVAAGGRIDLVEGEDGPTLRRHDQGDGMARQMDAMREVMRRRQAALRELAK